MTTKNRGYVDGKLIIYYQNTNGFCTRADVVKWSAEIDSHDLFVLTETGLHDGIHDGEIFPDEYEVFRCDRSQRTSDKGQKGGVLIAVKSVLQPSLVLRCDDEGLEQVWVKIESKSKSIYFAALYIPPRSELDLYERHVKKIEFMQNGMDTSDACFVFGDFNLSNVEWCSDDEEDTYYLMPVNATSDIEICVVDTLMSEELLQVNGVRNSNGRTLDLIFTNDFNNVSVLPSKSMVFANEIHHEALEIVYEIDVDDGEMSDDMTAERNFKKADFSLLIIYHHRSL